MNWSFCQEIPFVYSKENTGSDCPKPVFHDFSDLRSIKPLPDPFEKSDGSARDTSFANWRCRRAEIKSEIEYYEIGKKPERPDSIAANYSEGTLIVNITVNGETLKLTSEVYLPDGAGPFPAIIGIGRGTGTLPKEIFSSREIATITFNFGQVMAHTQNRGNEPINKLYPDLTFMGAYSAWSWGVSRLIDGLELVSKDLPVDLKHIAITGCSFAGKMALFAGAFDERIALTIAQEPGGGGAAAWRVSETLGKVETLGATSHQWFIEDMFRFKSNNVSKLPHDHHELMAMVAPRALLVLGNTDYEWLAEESGYVSCRAAHEVWKNFEIADRFGFSIEGGHGHCMLPVGQYPEVEAFIDKFLLEDTSANTNVTIHPFDNVDYSRWFEWWGKGNPVFPERDIGKSVTKFFEAELSKVGNVWDILEDKQASNEKYVTVKPGNESLLLAPTGVENLVVVEFSVDTSGSFALYARLNCASSEDDSFWVKIDDGDFEMFNGMGTSGWEWKKLTNCILEEGGHTISFGYREDGAKLDKISISNNLYAPDDTDGVNFEN